MRVINSRLNAPLLTVTVLTAMAVSLASGLQTVNESKGKFKSLFVQIK